MSAILSRTSYLRERRLLRYLPGKVEYVEWPGSSGESAMRTFPRSLTEGMQVAVKAIRPNLDDDPAQIRAMINVSGLGSLLPSSSISFSGCIAKPASGPS